MGTSGYDPAMSEQRPYRPLLVVAGPTASGKSALALAVAKEFGGTIINSDSMQVYEELRIITARPSDDEEAKVPHRLYGVLPAAERCSAGRWREMAVPEIEAVWAENRLPIIVGGTGLYLTALLDGLSELPDVPPGVREKSRALHDEIGPEAFHSRLAKVDPDTAARLPQADTQRLTRAYEIYLATGRSLTDWYKVAPITEPLTANVQTFLLEPPREELYDRCDTRFDWMINNGALEDVQNFLSLGLDPGLPVMKALGVPELAAHLAGDLTLEEAVEKAKQTTRNFAKRQMTWFRNQIEKPDAVFAQYSERINQKIFSKVCF